MDIVCKNAWIVDGRAFETYIEAEEYIYNSKKLVAAYAIYNNIDDEELCVNDLIRLMERNGFKYSPE